MKKHIIGIVALLLGASALVCAVLRESGQDKRERESLHQEQNEGVTFDIKGFKIALGKKHDSVAEAEPASPRRQYSPMLIATLATAIVAIVLGPISWVREKQPVLSITAMALGAVALAWQYVLIGITAGIAIVIVGAILWNMDF
ncbi:MAG: hypothetical protein HQ559_13725 [Lentisphaerae bacterium]|nr:hypothetical protein [Lentisphaerota bacterium]